MIRALLRLLSMTSLAVAVIMAVLDATRSIAAGQLALTPLGDTWMSLSRASLEAIEQMFVARLPGFFWDPVMTAVLQQPGFVVFAALALLLAVAGRRRRQPLGRLAARR